MAVNDEVSVAKPSQPLHLQPNPHLQIETLYADQTVLVVNKPGSIPCHPLRPSDQDALVNAVIVAYPEVAQAGDKRLEGGLIHRLDNGTSGALIIARTHDAFAKMRTAIRSGEISRRYLAVCSGHLQNAAEIATPIAHHAKNQRKMVTLEANVPARSGARPASTLVRPLRHYMGFTLIEARPRTGCRHQLRVHLASIGYPLAGDILYDGPEAAEFAPDRFWLHLQEVAFSSPSNGYIRVQAPLPADLERFLSELSPS